MTTVAKLRKLISTSCVTNIFGVASTAKHIIKECLKTARLFKLPDPLKFNLPDPIIK